MTGEYKTTLDEKGRLMFPSKLRTELSVSLLVITRGIDGCLWMFPPERWQAFYEALSKKVSLFDEHSRSLLRRLIAPAQEITLDKVGRIAVPQSLREYAGLKGDCRILYMQSIFELWDGEKYEKYLIDTEDSVKLDLESLQGIEF
ncbi:MAG: division/cell wall cluster transcriptional repressor MraZ [Treponema sp.]